MYKQKCEGGRTPAMLFIQFQNIFHTPYGRIFFSFSSLFHRCNYNSFHLPLRDHLEYCKDCVKLETLQGTLFLWQSVSSSFAKFSFWPVDGCSAEHPAWGLPWGVLTMSEGWTLSLSLSYMHHHLPSGMQLSAWSVPQPSFSYFFIITRVFSDPGSKRTLITFYTTFSAGGILASTSCLCHMEPNKDWTWGRHLLNTR